MRKKDDQSRKEQDELSAGIESLKVEPFSNTPVVNDEIKSFDSLLKQMQDETHQSEKILEDLKENAKNLEHIMDQVQNSASNLEASQTDLKSLSESVEAFLTNDELFEKISKNLDQILDELNVDDLENQEQETLKESTDPFQKDEQSDTKKEKKVKVTVLNLNKKEDFSQTSEAHSDDTLSQKLSEKLQSHSKLKNKNLQVKIITLDPNNQADILDQLQPNGQLSTLFSSLFQTNKQYENYKSLESSYKNGVYNADNIESKIRTDNSNNRNEDSSLNFNGYDENNDEEFKIVY